MLAGMKVEKMSISMDPELGDDVRAAAQRAGTSVSAWVAEAAAARLRRQALGDFLASWQDEHGEITTEELARARAELGYPHKANRVA
jgi:hypothetical protein